MILENSEVTDQNIISMVRSFFIKNKNLKEIFFIENIQQFINCPSISQLDSSRRKKKVVRTYIFLCRENRRLKKKTILAQPYASVSQIAKPSWLLLSGSPDDERFHKKLFRWLNRLKLFIMMTVALGLSARFAPRVSAMQTFTGSSQPLVVAMVAERAVVIRRANVAEALQERRRSAH